MRICAVCCVNSSGHRTDPCGAPKRGRVILTAKRTGWDLWQVTCYHANLTSTYDVYVSILKISIPFSIITLRYSKSKHDVLIVVLSFCLWTCNNISRKKNNKWKQHRNCVIYYSIVWLKLLRFDYRTTQNCSKITTDVLSGWYAKMIDILARGAASGTSYNYVIQFTTRTNIDLSPKRHRDSERFDPDGIQSCYKNGPVKSGTHGTNATSKELQHNVEENVVQQKFSFTHFQLLSDLLCLN